MPSKLQVLLKKIDPAQTIKPNYKRSDEAVTGFSFNKPTIVSWEEMQDCLESFNRYLYQHQFPSGNVQMDQDFSYGLAIQHLEKKYPENTSTTVFSIMSSGAEGGVYTILKALAQAVAVEFSSRVIGSHVSKYWDSLSTDEKLSASDEYIDLYQDILPASVLSDRVRFKTFFWKVLEDHPWMLKRIQTG